MPVMDYEREITELKRRVDEMEREVDGEKMLSRHIYQKVQANERLLLEIRDQVGTVRTDVTSLRGDVKNLRADVDAIRSDVNKLKSDVAWLRAELPGVVSQAVIQTLREPR
jgi:chromosome segregation ATPase